MYRYERMGSLVIFALVATLLCALVVCAGQAEQQDGIPRTTSILSADIDFEDESGTYGLPCSIGGLSPHSTGVMTFSADVERGDVLFLHSVYTSYKVYADGQQLASIGDNPPPVHVGSAHGGAHDRA